MKYFLYKATLLYFPEFIINILRKSKFLKPIRNWLLEKNKHQKQNKYIRWNGFGFHFFANPRVLLKASTSGVESSLTRAMLKIINRNSNVIDIGSNYGFITIVLGIFIKEKGGTIYSFECNKEIFLNLETSIKKNNLKNVKIYNSFLGAENKKNSQTVDSILKNENPYIDLIKIDTDGTDLDCLRGCSQIINKSHPVIVIEINNNIKDIIQYLKKKNYNYFYNQSFKIINDANPDPNEVPNLIASIKNLDYKFN